MPSAALSISAQTRRRFILGQQGLWPGRRWRGKAGLAEALRQGAVVQIDQMTVLAPLEIASARGRAKTLFGFEYLWEVYKPAETRRWGYYTLPLLWGDRLVARFDSRLERASRTLRVLNFWVEDGVQVDSAFRSALHAGLRRFLAFIGAEHVEGVKI